MASKIVYVDMDHVLCDYATGYARWKKRHPELEHPQSQPGMYLNLTPIDGAIETYQWLDEHASTQVYILTAPSVKNPHCYSEKRLWVEKFLGMGAVGNLIISAHKGLNIGDFLIDDCTTGKGQDAFLGQLIQFGSNDFPNWASIKAYFQEVLHNS